MVAAVTWWAGGTRADTTSLSGATEITSLPCAINAPGVYYLNQDFLSLHINNANAITVNAAGVTIDFNGHTISNAAVGPGVVASGIASGSNATGLTVRNGTIRGFAYGAYLLNSADYGVLIENMRFLDCTYSGVGLFASKSTIRHCQVFRTGGSTLPQCPNGVGMLVIGSNDSVQDCDVSELTSTSPSVPTMGIYINSASGVLVLSNRISGAQYGVAFDTQGSGKYRDNLCAASVTTPYSGGTDVGNN